MKLLRVAGVVALVASAVWAGDPKMTAEERAKATKLFKESHDHFLKAVEKLSDEQWNFKPAPDRWSVGECAEHIMLSERLIFGSVERALAADANADWEAKTQGKSEFLERVLPDRSRKAQAPEPIQPGKQNLTRAEIMARFKELRAKSLKFAETTELPLKQHTVDHPFPVFNTLNAYQWLIYVPLHHIRHNQQIDEVLASPGFPK
jgi:uncharacterized damage-inducible protein DinB